MKQGIIMFLSGVLLFFGGLWGGTYLLAVLPFKFLPAFMITGSCCVGAGFILSFVGIVSISEGV